MKPLSSPCDTDHKRTRLVSGLAFALFSLLLAALFGALTHWPVFEYDVFWHVRAGREILETGQVQTVDRWSHTVYGSPWYNFHWLSSLALYLFSRVGSEPYAFLSWLRSILVFAWILGLIRLSLRPRLRALPAHAGKPARKSEPQPALLDTPWSPILVGSIVIPWIYLICYFRLQMRPDLSAACLYVGFLCVWNSALGATAKKASSLGILLVWANFHSGTVPTGIILFWTFVLSEVEWKISRECLKELLRKFPWCLAALACWFATLQHFHVITVIWQTVLHYDPTVTDNPDQQPFSWELLELRNGGWSIILWVFYSLAAASSYVWLRKSPEVFPGIYRNRQLVVTASLLLTLLTLQKIRAIHYQAAFLLPVVVTGLQVAFSRIRDKNKGAFALTALLALGIFWLWILPDYVRFHSKPLRSGLYEADLPVQSVAFIKRTRPAGRLFNGYGFGGYLVGELPEYPIAVDGREIPFLDFIKETKAAKHDTARLAEFLQRYRINVILEKIPGSFHHPQYGFLDMDELFFPKDQWALVFFDNASVVYLRRIPENEAIISRYEYKFIRRGLPMSYAAFTPGLPEGQRAGWLAELDRCLTEMPTNASCLGAKATFLRARKQPEEALKLALQAAQITPENPGILLELSFIYETLGQTEKAKATQERFSKRAVPL